MAMNMYQEIIITAIGVVCCCLFLFVDKKLYKRLDMSPIFGSLKEKKYEDKVNGFAIGISWHIIIFSALVFGFFKVSGFITDDFSLKTLGFTTFISAIIGNIITRTIVSIVIEDKNDEDSDFEL